MILLVVILIGLNAASYVQKEKIPDSEFRPNRSTYNIGATGTRAFYDFLVESGYQVARWREPVSQLEYNKGNDISTFVVVGRIRREFTDDEVTKLMAWVSAGGRLIVIDRDPPSSLVATTTNYSIQIDDGEKDMADIEKETLLFSVDPSNQMQMTGDTKAAKPLQPTLFTADVRGVQPSKFASSISFSRLKGADGDSVDETPEIEAPEITDDEVGIDLSANTSSTPAPESNQPAIDLAPDEIHDRVEKEKVQTLETDQYAPVVHLGNDRKTLLADIPFGFGQVIVLTDPYIITNGGIRLADNIQLATNIVGSRTGTIAFDEYHQGYGNNENRLLAYFSGTPLVAIVLQIFAIIGLIFFSQGRRFARALPADEPSRLSKLEYVSAMAQLQQRTKAFDLAIENIYSDFRRRVARLVGVDNHTTSREELAALISERTGVERKELEELMFKCEDITHGEPTNKKEITELSAKIRQIEEKLGLVRRKRKPLKN